MYNLPYHKENDPERVKDFIARYPFAFIIGGDRENKPVATQIPMFIEESGGKKYLRGHMMKNNDHHRAFLDNEHVLAIFYGPDHYVSGTWYSKPGIPSTWNYMSVHVRGRIRFLDKEALVSVLKKTSLHFENYNESSTTIFDNLMEGFAEKAMPMIEAFEIEISDIDTVFKLSQDRDYKSYLNIIRELGKSGDDGKAIASEMEKRISEVFRNT